MAQSSWWKLCWPPNCCSKCSQAPSPSPLARLADGQSRWPPSLTLQGSEQSLLLITAPFPHPPAQPPSTTAPPATTCTQHKPSANQSADWFLGRTGPFSHSCAFHHPPLPTEASALSQWPTKGSWLRGGQIPQKQLKQNSYPQSSGSLQ